MKMYQHPEVLFDVILIRSTPRITNEIPVIFRVLISSPNNRIPKKAVPAVPPPAQTGYAMLTGSDFITRLTRKSASVKETRATLVGKSEANPSLNLNPKTPVISKQTAKINSAKVDIDLLLFITG